jgi:two-component system response regulator AtoC
LACAWPIAEGRARASGVIAGLRARSSSAVVALVDLIGRTSGRTARIGFSRLRDVPRSNHADCRICRRDPANSQRIALALRLLFAVAMDSDNQTRDNGAAPSAFRCADPESRGMSFMSPRQMAVAQTLAHDGSADPGLQIVSVEGDVITVHDLPERGTVSVGRGEDVNVRLTDPGASARHCILHVDGSRVVIEDLGSRNGTQIRGQRIEVGERVSLAMGESALVAGAVLLLQRKNRQLQQRRSLPHGYFELRLGEECLQAQNDGNAEFSIVRLDLEDGVDADAFAKTATELLRASDIFGTYAPDAYEILLRNTSPEDAAPTLDPLLERLKRLGAEPRAAYAHFPADGRTAHALIERACARLRPAAATSAPPGVIVLDPGMREVYRLAEKAAGREINVLILGETGVGKEILAEAIHRGSKRADKPFVRLNSAGLSESLRESELFGHERGAFTDAKMAKPGLLEMADGGTVFFDEIGEMSPSMQAMLLRAIESKQVMRVGGQRPRTIDVRFVAATNRDLVQEIREKRFRSDLYYRLNGISLEIPPLRERRLEIQPLAEAFLAQLSGGADRAPRLSDEAAALLTSHAWDGNIRELRNVIDRALLLCDGDTIEPEHLPLETIQRGASPARLSATADVAIEALPPADLSLTPEQRAERERIVAALQLEGGNQSRAARRLGMSRSTLATRLDDLGIPRPQKRPS